MQASKQKKLAVAKSKNNQDQSTSGSAVKSCPLQDCELTAFTLTCAHKRSLDIAGGKPTHNNKEYVLQVISKPNDLDEITVDFKGSCGKGNSSCPSVKVTGKEVDIEKTGQIKFNPLAPTVRYGDVGFLGFLKRFLIPSIPDDLEPEIYTVKSQKCYGSGKYKATVQAFPSFSWKSDISFGYNQPAGFGETDNKTGFKKLKGQGQWALEGKTDLNIGGRTWTFGGSRDPKEKEYFPGLKGTLSKIVPFLSDLGCEVANVSCKGTKEMVKFNVDWPKVTLAGGLELVELAKDYSVDMGGDVSLKMAPLIGASVETDILDWIIRISTTAYSEFLIRIKKKAAEGAGNKYIEGQVLIGIILKIGGKVEGELKWNKKPTDKWVSVEGDKTGEIKADVGVVRAEGRVFYVKLALGTELSLKGAKVEYDKIGIVGKVLVTTAAEQPALRGSLIFTGAAIYYTYYAEVGLSAMDSDKDKKKEKGKRHGSKKNKVEEKKEKIDPAKKKGEESGKLVEILSACEWPKPASKTNEINQLESVPI